MNFKKAMKYILEITLQTLHGMFKILKADQVWARMHIRVCVWVHLPQPAAFHVLQSQHILPSAVHHSDSRVSSRGSE